MNFTSTPSHTHLLSWEYKIDFDEFKEAFVDLLTQDVSEEEDSLVTQDTVVSSEKPLSGLPHEESTSSAIFGDEDTQVIREDSSPDLKEEEVTIQENPLLSDHDSQGDHDPSMKQTEVQSMSKEVTHDSVETNQRNSSTKTTEENTTSEDSNKSMDDLDSVRDYIQSIWTQLGVGHNGYLNVNELHSVCLGIGMNDMTEVMVNQLFLTLDEDEDGKVSFDELLSGMFRQQQAQDVAVPPDESSISESTKATVMSQQVSPNLSPSLSEILSRSKERREMREQRRHSRRKLQDKSNDNQMTPQSFEDDDEEDILVVVQSNSSGQCCDSSSSCNSCIIDIDSQMRKTEFFSSSPRKSCGVSRSVSFSNVGHHHHHRRPHQFGRSDHHDKNSCNRMSLPSTSSLNQIDSSSFSHESILSNSFYLYSMDVTGKG